MFGGVGLSFDDVTNGWTAGQVGDCIGMIVSSWSPTSIVFSFGNQYANYGPVVPGDQFSFELQGHLATGAIT